MDLAKAAGSEPGLEELAPVIHEAIQDLPGEDRSAFNAP